MLASATEIVCALGLEDHLIARSHECDFPPSVRQLPVCTAPAIPVSGSSAEIDLAVKERLGHGLSIYHVDRRLLQELRPDLIITQSHCAVCAVNEADVDQALLGWPEPRPHVVSLQPNCLKDIWADIRRVADACGVEDEGRLLVHSLQKRMADLGRRARNAGSRPGVICIEWLEPLMAAGNWTPELIRLAGGVPLLAEPGRHSSPLAWKTILTAEADVIIVAPCGFGIERTAREIQVLESQPAFHQLGAVKEGKVYLADGNELLNRPGPRVVEALEVLAEILHPHSFDNRHYGTGWISLQATGCQYGTQGTDRPTKGA
jgi:iron complex transport system substrate-binding protein